MQMTDTARAYTALCLIILFLLILGFWCVFAPKSYEKAFQTMQRHSPKWMREVRELGTGGVQGRRKWALATGICLLALSAFLLYILIEGTL